jgi:hypothetical protein
MEELYNLMPPAEVWDKWYEEESAKIAEEEKEYQEMMEESYADMVIESCDCYYDGISWQVC